MRKIVIARNWAFANARTRPIMAALFSTPRAFTRPPPTRGAVSTAWAHVSLSRISKMGFPIPLWLAKCGRQNTTLWGVGVGGIVTTTVFARPPSTSNETIGPALMAAPAMSARLFPSILLATTTNTIANRTRNVHGETGPSPGGSSRAIRGAPTSFSVTAPFTSFPKTLTTMFTNFSAAATTGGISKKFRNKYPHLMGIGFFTNRR
jgi:hypothetical protein